MTPPVLRIHPTIGFARVGNSEGDENYYLAPDTSAGMAQNGTPVLGGLPIKPGTESTPIDDADIRDKSGALKRQGQRFRIYQYDDAEAAGTYPYKGTVSEVKIGSTVGGKQVQYIAWTVHLANKKANGWVHKGGLQAFDPPHFAKIRNPDFEGTPRPANPHPKIPSDRLKDEDRLKALVIDAGPRVVHGAKAARVHFDAATTPTHYEPGAGVAPLPNYPVSFPQDHFTKLNSPSSVPVTDLGGIETDDEGRLIVIGGEGTATGWYKDENTQPPSGPDEPMPLSDDVDNDGWFDDTCDGPVRATLVFDDNTTLELASTAWIVSTDPAYAPQIRNVVSLWDDALDLWVRRLGLDSSLYDDPADPDDDSGYNKAYEPSFADDIFPIFRSAHLQMFTTGLNDTAKAAHGRLDNVTADDDPTKYLHVESLIRSPYATSAEVEAERSVKMPLALGDTNMSFLNLTKTQYFFLTQWFKKKFKAALDAPLTHGEQLDKDALTNCLGGRFSPGIDMSYPVRDPVIYDKDWRNPNVGAFRMNAAALKYETAVKDRPFLTRGYTPQRPETQVEPGDMCKFMAVPWHTDYNSCATHLSDPNPGGAVTDPNQIFDGRNTTLLWSWPAQRPVSVYAYTDLGPDGQLPKQQRFSVRGEGTQSLPGPDGGVWPKSEPDDPNQPGSGPDGTFFEIQQVGRFQVRQDMLDHWHEIGVTLQGPAIKGYDDSFDRDYFLEVESQMGETSDIVEEYPNNLPDAVTKTP